MKVTIYRTKYNEDGDRLSDDGGLEYDLSFRDALDALIRAYPSTYPLPANGEGVWYSECESGTREYYEHGISTELTIHPQNEHAERWLAKAWIATHPCNH